MAIPKNRGLMSMIEQATQRGYDLDRKGYSDMVVGSRWPAWSKPTSSYTSASSTASAGGGTVDATLIEKMLDVAKKLGGYETPTAEYLDAETFAKEYLCDPSEFGPGDEAEKAFLIKKRKWIKDDPADAAMDAASYGLGASRGWGKTSAAKAALVTNDPIDLTPELVQGLADDAGLSEGNSSAGVW